MSSLLRQLNISHPIVQSGMGRVAGPELAAEVSRAGGLGILAGLNVAADDLRAQVRRVRALTDAPFGVNRWLHPEVVRPIDPATLAAASNLVPAVRPQPRARGARRLVEERVPLWSVGLGLPAPAAVWLQRLLARRHILELLLSDSIQPACVEQEDFTSVW